MTHELVSPAMRQQARFAFKTAVSVAVFLPFAFWMGWDAPTTGVTTILSVSLDTTGATLQKGLARLLGNGVGLVVSLVAVALFAQQPLQMTAFLCVYLAVTAYGMQRARYNYAWFLAAMLPVLVWSKSYQNELATFQYAVFRFLEIAAGVTLYTVVSAVLWPQRAGRGLQSELGKTWSLLQHELGSLRARLEQGATPDDVDATSQQLNGALATLSQTLDWAYEDTPDVRRQRRHWEDLRVSLRALRDSFGQWGTTISDLRDIGDPELIGSFGAALDRLEERFTWVAETLSTPTGGKPEGVDQELFVPLDLVEGDSAPPHLSTFDRAAVLNFRRQLRAVDEATRQVLSSVHALRWGSAPGGRDFAERYRRSYEPSFWRPDYLRDAFFIVTAFLSAIAVWYYLDPPGGPGGVYFTTLLALIVARSGGTPQSLLKAILISIFCFGLPVYVFVLPHITLGLHLSIVLFLIVFVSGLLGRISPLLKILPPMFVVVIAGLSNQQSYSIQGPIVMVTMMTLYALVLIALYALLIPSRSEQLVVGTMRRFLRGCSRITAQWGVPGAESARTRRRTFESAVLPAASKLRAAGRKLDADLLPNKDPRAMERLATAVESIAVRLEAADRAVEQSARGEPASLQAVSGPLTDVRDHLRETFEDWRTLSPSAYREGWDAELSRLSTEVERALEQEEVVAEDVYMSLGTVRGIVHAMRAARPVMAGLDWSLLARPRFG